MTRSSRSLTAAGYDVVDAPRVADGIDAVAGRARASSTDGFAGSVVTTGRHRLRPARPHARRHARVIEREAPGIVEAIRRASDDGGRGFGMLSRAVAGTRGAGLICNLPGSASGAIEASR